MEEIKVGEVKENKYERKFKYKKQGGFINDNSKSRKR